jgi:biofilm PGA synthesis N-glycosyltransferase PgaC
MERRLFPGSINPCEWYGAVLCLACLVEFFVSFVIDRKYEKHFMKNYFWVIWYPLVYWIIITFTTIKAVYNVSIKRKAPATWQSPDRGLHTLKS